MKKASDLRQELSAIGLDEAEINGAISKGISKGVVVDDENAAAASVLDIEKAMGALDKALSALEQSGAQAREAIAKGASASASLDAPKPDEEGGVDVTAQIEAIAKGAMAMEKAVNSQHAVAVEALGAIAKGVMAQAAVIKAQGHALARLEQQNAELIKAIGAPMPPRALTGAAPIEHPGELAKGGGQLEAQAFIDSAMKELRNPQTEANRRHTIAKAMSLVQEGAPIAEVRAALNL